MRVNSLLYHDVVPTGQPQASGFQDPIAARYKLDIPTFIEHLDRIADAVSTPTANVLQLDSSSRGDAWLLTFDDGGRSFLTEIAPLLETRGWCGHFFITTNLIGTPGFLTQEELCELHQRGHVIGSHSCSHPPRMSSLSDEELLKEWRESVAFLNELLETETTTASVPGGFYSRRVAQAAIDAGIRYLFTSEPSSRIRHRDGCQLLGRCSIVNTTPSTTAAGFARGSHTLRVKQSLLWNMKKTAKLCLGGFYRRASESFWKLKGTPATD